MSKFAGFIIGAALIAVGVITGNVGLIVQGGAMIVTQAIVDLTMPKTPARQASELSIQLGETPRVMLVGETATPGSLVDGFNYGGKYDTDWECLVIRLADHICEGLTGFYVNDEYNPYTGDGLVGRYDDQLEIYFRSDTTTQTISSRVTDEGPGWTADDVGESGCDVVVCYKADKAKDKHPGWPGGRPRFLFVVKGALCYDPRLDSTVTGGSGAHRDDDPATWEWSANPIICRYKWVRGVYANDDVATQSALLVGRGLTAEEAPPENIIAAANLCEENTSSTLRYETHPTTLTLDNCCFSPDGTQMLMRNGSGDYELWYVPTRTLQGSGTGPVSIGGRPAIDNSGNIWSIRAGGGSLDEWRINGSLLKSIGPGFLGAIDVRIIDNVVFIVGTLSTTAHYYDGAGVVDVSVGFTIHNHVTDGANTWVVGNSGSTLGFYCVLGPRAGDNLSVASPGGSSSALHACNPGNGNFVCVQGTSWFLVDDTTGVAGTPVAVGISVSADEMERILPGDFSTWINWSHIQLEPPLLLETVNPLDWASGSTDRPLYDRINNAIIADDAGTPLMWRFISAAVGYRVSGPIYANQDFIDVEQMFAAAIAGNVITHEGSVELEPAQAKSVVATITDDDILVGSQVNWNQGCLSEANAEWVNSVVARYVEPAQQWQDHAAPVARDTDDIVDDGKPREATLTLRLVRDLKQAQRVAEINRRLGRLWGRGSVKLGPRFCELEEGDWITWTSARYGFAKTFRIEAYSIDEKWQITLTLREISTSVFDTDDADFGDDGAVPVTPRLPPPDIGSPDGGDWALTAGTLDSSGASVPALVIDGAVPSDENASEVIVEYWKDDGVLVPTDDPDAIPWTNFGTYPPDTTHIEITSLTGGETYWIALSYVVSGITGDRLVLGPQVVADLDVSPQLNLEIDVVAGTTYSIVLGDAWRHKRFTNSGAITVTVPKNATSAYPIGGRTRLTAAGTGDVTLVPEDGTVTLNSRDAALTSAGEMAVFEIEKVATNEWDVLGDVTT